ncbi:MAG: thioredoxin-disulfide reductase [Hyphomicrobiales bacterium]|nr:thioredoxin-disulfide reductase [Hyphomicrobiales bacterium]
MSQHHARVLVIGSGPAGYTAAIYAARAMLEPVLIAGVQIGGQLTVTTEVENYPGFAEPIQGPWLVEQMRLQAEHCGAKMITDTVTRADLSVRPFRLDLDGGDAWTCDVLIVATGAQAKWLGIPSEEKFRGFGVSACATCDGFFYRGKEVVVVGGGNSAVEEALYLTNHASKVTVVHRRDSFRAEKVLQQRLFAHPKIEVVWNAAVAEVLGNAGFPPSVTGVRIEDVKTGETRDIPCDGFFVAIGHSPAVSLVEGQLKLKPSGYLWVEPGTSRTSIPGVFAAGDVCDDVYRQAVTAAGMGCMAALEAEKYLAGHGA